MRKLLIAGGVVLALMAIAVGAVSIMLGDLFSPSRDEVARLASPTGEFEAVVFEGNGGATTSFWYEVHVLDSGRKLSEMNTTKGADLSAVYLYGAVTAIHYGLALNWVEPNSLEVGVASARVSRLHKPVVQIGDREVVVSLRSGVTDTEPPLGGILYVCCPEPHILHSEKKEGSAKSP